MLLGAASLEAHDPYEITSVVYVRSNMIELFIEAEFPTGLTLAGLTPTRDVAAETQFEAGLPQLKNFAGGLFEITAGNNPVQPLSTNVELGVELHIRGRVELASTDYRPLRFVPRGLKAVPDVPYGVSLTVLDIVNQKVLGQSVLFADSPPAEFPATESLIQLAQPTLAVRKPVEPPGIAIQTNESSATRNEGARRQFRWPVAVLIIGAVVGLVVAWLRSNARA